MTFLSEEEAGESINSKIERVRKEIRKHNCDSFVVTTLDDVCWLLNIRGEDVQYNPYVYAYVFLDKEKLHLFIHENRISPDHPHFNGVNIEFHKYDEFYSFMKQQKPEHICFDENCINYSLYEILQLMNPKGIFEFILLISE